jgi:hypothetical protein
VLLLWTRQVLVNHTLTLIPFLNDLETYKLILSTPSLERNNRNKNLCVLKTNVSYVYCKKSLKIPKEGNQNLYIEEEQTTQWPKEKVQKDKQRSTKHTHKTKDRATRTPLKTGGELRCSGRVSSSCSISGTRRVNLITCFLYKRVGFLKCLCKFNYENRNNLNEMKTYKT